AADHGRRERAALPEKRQSGKGSDGNAADSRDYEITAPRDRGRRLPEGERDAPVGVLDRRDRPDSDRDAEDRQKEARRMPPRGSRDERPHQKKERVPGSGRGTSLGYIRSDIGLRGMRSGAHASRARGRA